MCVLPLVLCVYVRERWVRACVTVCARVCRSMESGAEFEQTMLKFEKSDCVVSWKMFDETYLKPLLGGKPRRSTSGDDASEDSSMLSVRDHNPLQPARGGDATHNTPTTFGHGVPRDSVPLKLSPDRHRD